MKGGFLRSKVKRICESEEGTDKLGTLIITIISVWM